MAKAEIMSVGTEIPGDVAEYVPFNSSRSLLDADIILFEPRLDYDTDRLRSTYQGKPSLSDRSSVQTRAAIKHWRSELKHAIEAGKTIFIFLPAPEEVYANTGTQNFLEQVGIRKSFDMWVQLITTRHCRSPSPGLSPRLERR